MANFWSSTLDAAIDDGEIETYEFVQILVDVLLTKTGGGNNNDNGIYLSTYHANIEIGGNEYVADLLQGVGVPAVTGQVSQEVQSLIIGQSLAGFGQSDIVDTMGDNYHQARIIMTSYPVDNSGTLLTGEVYFQTDGIISQVSRDVSKAQVQIDFSNSYGQLNIVRELRTTKGSLKRVSGTDTTFDKAAAIDPTLALAWGTNN